MTGLLDRKVAIIIGAGSGIGASTAKISAREGASVAFVDVSVEAGQRVTPSQDPPHFRPSAERHITLPDQ